MCVFLNLYVGGVSLILVNLRLTCVSHLFSAVNIEMESESPGPRPSTGTWNVTVP